MLHFIFLLLSIGSIILGTLKGLWDDGLRVSLIVGGVCGAIIFSIASLVIIISGANAYIDLSSKQQKIITIESHAQRIKDARYKDVESGKFVGGSLDNAKQSSVYSDYLSSLAYEKARYNQDLTEAQLKLNSIYHILLSDGLFISKKVLNLKKEE